MESKPPHTSKDPLHGVTLETIITRLVEQYGWEDLGADLKMRCFSVNPSVKSCLTFLRKTPWARKKVEDLYVGTVRVNDYERQARTDFPAGDTDEKKSV